MPQMAKYLCPCGGIVHTSGTIPHPLGLYILTEKQYEERADAEDFDVILESTGAHRCPDCARLWVWWDGWESEPTIYAPERH